MFPTELRSTGSSFIFFTSSIAMAILSKLFSQFLTWFGFHGSLWFYSGVIFLSFLYGFFAMPEHADVSLMQIEKGYKIKGKKNVAFTAE